ncbi:hypothetical protein CPC08DRAFT_824871 [Agrocybe pediades]|nr:hypothetical protein CPC08DRAFT_824871 [Agrocybe pediades]
MQFSTSTLQSISSVYPEVAQLMSFEACVKYVELVQILKPSIKLYLQPNEEGPLPLERLPLRFHRFLTQVVGIEHEVGKHVWIALSPVAWALPDCSNGAGAFGYHLIQSFLDYGYEENIAFYHFTPPVTVCLEPNCTKMRRAPKSHSQLKRKRHSATTDTTPDVESSDEPPASATRPLMAHLEIDVTVFTQDLGPTSGKLQSDLGHLSHLVKSVSDLSDLSR